LALKLASSMMSRFVVSPLEGLDFDLFAMT
jgi:hypothetical protein